MKKQRKNQWKKAVVLTVIFAMLFGNTLSATAAGYNSLRDVFDARYYAEQYPDLKEAFGYDEEALYQHYITYGISEGRTASLVFDITKYREQYGDLEAAFGDDLDAYVTHYFTYGIMEGRESGGAFDPVAYAQAYPDVQAAFGDDMSAIVDHYLTYGKTEGRSAGVNPAAANATAAGQEEKNQGGTSQASTSTPAANHSAPSSSTSGSSSSSPSDSSSSSSSSSSPSDSSSSDTSSDSSQSGGSTESGSTESGSTESGSTDSGDTDSGSTDSGSTDSGSTDSGSTDSGSTDSGSTDSGSTDSDTPAEEAASTKEYVTDKGHGVTEYNAEGKLIRSTFYPTDTSSYGYSYCVTEYDSSERPKKMSLYNADDSLKLYSIYEYSDSGRTVTYYYSDGHKQVQRYDNNNNMVETCSYNADGLFQDRRVDEYDSDGNRIKETCYTENDTIYNIYGYYSNGTKKYVEVYDGETGKLSLKKEYDVDGNKTITTWYYSDGSTERYRLNYQEKRIEYFVNDGITLRADIELTIDGREITDSYGYSCSSDKPSPYKISLFYGSNDDCIRVEIEFDSEGNETQRTTYDSDGNVISTTGESSEEN